MRHSDEALEHLIELRRVAEHALGVIDECWRFAGGDEQRRESIRQARLHLAHAVSDAGEYLEGQAP